MSDEPAAALRSLIEGLEALDGRDSPERSPNRVIVGRTGSTNALARRIAACYQEDEEEVPPLTVFALEQTEGRGRQGRSWASPPGGGVYATRVLSLADAVKADDLEAALHTLPLLAGIGLARAIDGLLAASDADVDCRLKWPNDLLLGGKKVGGILAESLAVGTDAPVALVGFGVNLAAPAGELPLPGATGVADHLGTGSSGELGLGELARALIVGLEAELAHLGDLPRAVAAYREHSVHEVGERILCRTAGAVVSGTFEGFDDRGHLRLTCDGETVRMPAGEIVEALDPAREPAGPSDES